MRPESGDGPLPGGMSLSHARGHTRRRPPALLGIAAAALVSIGAAMGGNISLSVAFGLLTAAAIGYAAQSPGIRVTAQSQPELCAVVAQTAASLGARDPHRIWLTHRAEVTVQARRRGPDLLLGLPVLACLDEHEIRALIAHELAQTTFARPHLVLPLAKAWRDVAIARSDPDASSTDQLTERDLRNLALAVERSADTAAIDAAGSRESAARAIAVLDGLDMNLLDLRFDLDLPGPTIRRPAAQALEDIDEIWRRVLRDGLPLWLWYDGVAVELAHKHPPLAEAILALTEADVALRLARAPIRLRPLNRRSRRRLARGFFRISGLSAVRWHTIDTTPAQWWLARASRSIERLRGDVAQVLGRDPVDHAEVAEVLLLRNDEVVAVRRPATGPTIDSTESDATEDEPETLPPILRDLVEDALLRRGWRLEHPAVRGVLIGPRGERVDAMTLVAGPLTAPDLEPLRRLLHSHP